MVKDDQQYLGSSPPNGPGRVARSPWFKLAALLLVGVSFAAAAGFWAGRLRESGDEQPAAPQAPNPHNYRNWPKPDIAIMLSGEMHGYLQPCGCSDPQKGGLARRYKLMQTLKDRGWDVVAGDLGDVAQDTGPQAMIKYIYAMKALQMLHYTAIGIGEKEATLPLFNALGNYALNDHSPRVLSANLKDKEKTYQDMVGSIEVAGGQNGVPKVAFVSVVDESVAKLMRDVDVKFDPVQQVLAKLKQALQAANPDIKVLLFQGSEAEAKAYALAAQQNPNALPEFQIILWRGGDVEPSEQPQAVGNSLLFCVGHKGQYVGIAGAYKTGNPNVPCRFHYNLVAINPEFETPAGQENTNPIHALMQKYAQEIKDEDYLSKYSHNAKHPVQIAFPEAEYVGSDACEKCHEHAYKVWKNSPHAEAYDALVNKAKRPTLRQFDGECITCHVTGFGYKTGFVNPEKTRDLLNVGCESCHGPASLHVNDRKNVKFREALNPLKAKPGEDPQRVMLRQNDACAKCHDLDNSVHFNFETYWQKIAHPTPKKGAGAP